ncbi:MAG TPA: hypothetical protein VHK70_01540, partial [Burkholderiaceae bacterium]|nr:hypothetical protein [Burkholderiaceae bacterium]
MIFRSKENRLVPDSRMPTPAGHEAGSESLNGTAPVHHLMVRRRSDELSCRVRLLQSQHVLHIVQAGCPVSQKARRA